MNLPGFDSVLSGTARRLADAAAHGTGAELDCEIRRAQVEIDELSSRRPRHSAGDDERVELLGAVVQAMRQSVARSCRQKTSYPEGHEVHVRLLRHLARGPNFIRLHSPPIPLFTREPIPASRPHTLLARAV